MEKKKDYILVASYDILGIQLLYQLLHRSKKRVYLESWQYMTAIIENILNMPILPFVEWYTEAHHVKPLSYKK